MTDDLVGRLRLLAPYTLTNEDEEAMYEAAARIEALEGALRPFAEVAKHIGQHKRGIVIGYAHDNVRYEHFHAARAALAKDHSHAD